jgi:hypothetical protein
LPHVTQFFCDSAAVLGAHRGIFQHFRSPSAISGETPSVGGQQQSVSRFKARTRIGIPEVTDPCIRQARAFTKDLKCGRKKAVDVFAEIADSRALPISAFLITACIIGKAADGHKPSPFTRHKESWGIRQCKPLK